MKGLKIISGLLMILSFTTKASANYDSYADCKKTWKVCAVVGESGHLDVLQMNQQQVALDSALLLRVGAEGSVYLVEDGAATEIGALANRHETAFELRLHPDFDMAMAFTWGPDEMFCNRVDGPLGKRFFQRDYVHTKRFQIQIFEGQTVIADWINSKTQPVYPAYESKVSRKPCP
ncbi:MAG: hypothetical protein BroJett040_23510 [Oligoflexia bacterium]|nr:MAG: hypothetical protein BroJett040_23510 [Oligoflexia bacterium]